MRVASRMLKFPDGRERRANEGLVPDIVIEPRKGKPAEAPGEDLHLRLKNDVALQRACDLLQGLHGERTKARLKASAAAICWPPSRRSATASAGSATCGRRASTSFPSWFKERRR